MIESTQSKVCFTQHFKERLKQRNIDLNVNDIDIQRVIKLPYYIDNGCL